MFVFQDTATVTPAKLYTIKELVVVETSIADFHTSVYIPEIENLAFHLPRVRVLGTRHCVNTHREAFKRLSANQDVFFRRDYD